MRWQEMYHICHLLWQHIKDETQVSFTHLMCILPAILLNEGLKNLLVFLNKFPNVSKSCTINQINKSRLCLQQKCLLCMWKQYNQMHLNQSYRPVSKKNSPNKQVLNNLIHRCVFYGALIFAVALECTSCWNHDFQTRKLNFPEGLQALRRK